MSWVRVRTLVCRARIGWNYVVPSDIWLTFVRVAVRWVHLARLPIHGSCQYVVRSAGHSLMIAVLSAVLQAVVCTR
jgi:hypothetical protein